MRRVLVPPAFFGMNVKFGKARHMEKIKLTDYLKHPIWVSAHDDRHDEEWYKPVVSPAAVTKAVLKVNHPVVLFNVKGTEQYGCGYYDGEQALLYGLALWIKGRWKIAEGIEGLKTPLRLIVVPKILGK